GLTWQGAMGVVALEGVAILILMALGIRRQLLYAVPMALKIAIGAGIGAFIFAIGAFNGGLVVGTLDPTQAHPLDKGNLNSATAIVTLGGLGLTAFLY